MLYQHKGHSFITFALKRGGKTGPSKYELMRTMGGVDVTSVQTFAYKFF